MKIFKKKSKLLKFIVGLLIIGAIIGAVAYFLPKSAEAAWYDDYWKFRKKLVIDQTKVSAGPHANFPILVSLDNDVSLKDHTQSTGNDILFTDSTGTVKLDHEIESYTQGTGTLRAWVRIPSLISTADTTIYMYYGNSTAVSQQNATGVWDANTVGVWHLKENPASSAPQMTNSTSTANINGTVTGTWASTQQLTGKINGALDFNGSDDYVSMGTPATLQIAGNKTVSLWVKMDNITSARAWMAYENDLTPWSGFEFGWNHVSTANKIFIWQHGASGPNIFGSVDWSPSSNTWYNVTVTLSSGTATFYVNGQQQGSPVTGIPDATFDSAETFRIGSSTSSSPKRLDGSLDEVKVSNSARSAGWILTEYNNQNSPGTFFKSFGFEEKSKAPIAYFQFDEAQWSTINNSGSQGVSLQGTAANTTWQTEDLCVSGKCLFYNGTSAKVTVNNIIPSVKTVGLWVKPKTTTESIIDFDGGTHKITASGGTITATGFTAFYVNGKVSGTLTANQWQYIEATVSTAFDTTVAGLSIGLVNTTYFNGFIDELKMYDYVRSSDQIKVDATSRGSATVIASDAKQSLSQGLVGYWKMDEASWNGTPNEVVDSSGNGSNGTAACSGGGCTIATTTTGKFGNGGSFTGRVTGGYVTMGNISNLNFERTNSFSVGIWVKTTSNLSLNLIDKSIGSPYTGWNVQTTGDASNKVEIQLFNNYLTNAIDVKSTQSINDGNWHYVLFTYDGSSKASGIIVYIDGAKAPTTTVADTLTSSIMSSGPLNIGGTNNLAYCIATLDEARIYNRALSPKEVRDLYNWAPGPVGYWKMDEGSWTVDCSTASVLDSSGNGNNGKACPNSTGPRGGSVGKYGKAGSFDGVNDYVDITSNNSLKIQNAITLEAWVKGPGGEYPTIIQKGSGSVYDYGLREEQSSGGRARFLINTTTGIYSSNGAFPVNTWVHLAGTYDGTYLKIYLNGVLSNSSNIGSVLINASDNNLALGRPGTGNFSYWNGSIDDVKIYNYARTAKQIVEDMQARGESAGGQSAVSVKTPLIYLKIDEGTGGTANNSGSGGTGKNGTINSGTWTDSGKFSKGVNLTGSADSNISIPDFAY